MLDYVVGEAMTSWYLTEAVRHRDRSRLLRALALEASVYANIGNRWSLRRSASLLQWADRLMQDSHDPYDRAWIKLARTSSAWFGGNWRSCVDLARDTVAELRSECTGVNWDVAMSLSFGLSAQVFLGQFRQLNETIPELLDDAERRGDRYVTTVFRSGYLVFLPLADDRPEDAFRAAEATIEDVPSDRFTAFHFHHFNAATNALLYEGKAWSAWSLIEQRWPLIKQAGFLHLACIGSLLRELRARGALAAARDAHKAVSGLDERVFLPVALKEADAIAVDRRPTPTPWRPVSAPVLRRSREINPAKRAALLTAISGFNAAEMSVHHAAGRVRLGILTGGQEGSDMVATSKSFLMTQGVKNPDAMTALLFPGAP